VGFGLPLALLAASGAPHLRPEAAPQVAAADSPQAAAATDGRPALAALQDEYATLTGAEGWVEETVYVYPDPEGLAIRGWRTRHAGPALWILAGIHGEEPAGPVAIGAQLASITAVARAGVPIVLLPLCNPQAYARNWRYPNTPERDWRKGGYSVGDAEWLLPDLAGGTSARAPAPPGPETAALTRRALGMARDYPPRLVLDLHEDELSGAGGYVYSQGTRPHDNPVVPEVIRLLGEAGIPIRRDGRTRFGEPIREGVISRDDRGGAIRDGSIDELLAAPEVVLEGRREKGPGAPTVIVVETPAFAGTRLGLRAGAHGAVIVHLADLWRRAPVE
jgi:hypothetical protein